MESGISKEESVSRFGFDINMIDLSINNQWLDEADFESSFRNPNYNPDLGYGYHTPRFDKYKNEAFFKNTVLPRKERRPRSTRISGR